MKTAKTNQRPPSTINPLSGKPYPVMPGDATGPRTPQGKAVLGLGPKIAKTNRQRSVLHLA